MKEERKIGRNMGGKKVGKTLKKDRKIDENVVFLVFCQNRNRNFKKKRRNTISINKFHMAFKFHNVTTPDSGPKKKSRYSHLKICQARVIQTAFWKW